MDHPLLVIRASPRVFVVFGFFMAMFVAAVRELDLRWWLALAAGEQLTVMKLPVSSVPAHR
jgi:hypothetical protein